MTAEQIKAGVTVPESVLEYAAVASFRREKIVLITQGEKIMDREDREDSASAGDRRKAWNLSEKMVKVDDPDSMLREDFAKNPLERRMAQVFRANGRFGPESLFRIGLEGVQNICPGLIPVQIRGEKPELELVAELFGNQSLIHLDSPRVPFDRSMGDTEDAGPGFGRISDVHVHFLADPFDRSFLQELGSEQARISLSEKVTRLTHFVVALLHRGGPFR